MINIWGFMYQFLPDIVMTGIYTTCSGRYTSLSEEV